MRTPDFLNRLDALSVGTSQRPLAQRIWVAIAMVAVATTIRCALNPLLGNSFPWLLFYPTVLLSAWYGRLLAGLIATLLSIAITLFLWIEPIYSFRIQSVAEWVSVLTFAAMSLLISVLAESSHRATAAEQAQRREREAERRFFESALASITDAVMVVNKDWRCIYMNDVAATMGRKPRQEMMGQILWDIFPFLREDEFYRQVSRSREERIPVRFEYYHAPFDTWTEVRAYPMGESTAIYGMDISERKKIEADLRVTQQKLAEHASSLERLVAERTQKLQDTVAELERFSRFVAEDYHDKLDAQGHDYLERIRGAARRMDALINDVLIFSQTSRSEIQLRPIELDRLTHDIVSQYSSLRESAAHIEIQSPLRPVLGNETLLTQIISNLLSNAVKFVKPGQTPAVKIWTETRDSNVLLFVRDHGIGVSLKHQGKMFGMFERANEGVYEGTGIGLAIVKRAVERMNGTVSFESASGEGSTFRVELPQP
jgi:signal transduction histidine kinase